MKQTRQEMIEEREKIAEILTKAMGKGVDMSTGKYPKLEDKYHWLNEKIRKKGKKHET